MSDHARAPEDGPKLPPSDHPSHWKWGCIYYNPGNKRLFPPKRLPSLGYTVNFACFGSVLAFATITALGILFVEWLMAQHG